MANDHTAEVTFEITDYCPNTCRYCSSNAKIDICNGHFMSHAKFLKILGGARYDVIHISGGEPMANPDFYEILMTCYKHAKDVVVHTNALRHIAFNTGVIDNIYVDAYVTIAEDVDKVHIVKRVRQGREATRPEVHFSRNFTEKCHCDHRLYKWDGTLVKSPCDKWSEVKDNAVKNMDDAEFEDFVS